VLCIPTTTPGYYQPCIEKCDPYSLVFDTNTNSCVYPEEAFPGTCFDTPSSPESSKTIDSATISTATATMGIATVTRTTSTSTFTSGLINSEEETTPKPCQYTGHNIEYPGDCFKYFTCVPDGNGGYDTLVFTCSCPQVFDPTTGSCALVADCKDICEDGCEERCS